MDVVSIEGVLHLSACNRRTENIHLPNPLSKTYPDDITKTIFKKVKIKVNLEKDIKSQGQVEVKIYSFFNFGSRWDG